MDQFSHCPRCGNRTLEHLETYNHCIDCLYFEDHHYDSEQAYFEACVAELLIEDLESKSQDKTEDVSPEDELAS